VYRVSYTAVFRALEPSNLHRGHHRIGVREVLSLITTIPVFLRGDLAAFSSLSHVSLRPITGVEVQTSSFCYSISHLHVDLQQDRRFDGLNVDISLKVDRVVALVRAVVLAG